MPTLDGRAALTRLDKGLAGARRALTDAIETEKSADGDMARVRQAQAAAYLGLAALQLDQPGASDRLAALKALDGEVAALLDKQDTYIATLVKDLEARTGEIAALEEDRQAGAAALDEAIDQYETAVAEVEASLEERADYQALVEAAAEAEAVTERARQKHLIAQEDRIEKGAPYEADPLFMYLWKRKFRTVDYEASPPFRFLDGWVARLCRYDRAYRNYDRLTALPGRIAGHVSRMEAAEAEAQLALETAEHDALQAAGAAALEAAVETARGALADLDARIETAEAEHLALADAHAAAEAGDRGPAHAARLRLAEALKQASFPDLRLLVTQTVTADDDQLVDQLVTLRRQEMALDMRRDDLAEAPRLRRQALDTLERFRRLFKLQQLDSPYATFAGSALDGALDALLAGRLRPEDAVRSLKRKMRRRQPKAHPRFGGANRRRTSGLPELVQDVGWEILKEVARSGGGRARGRGGSPFGGFPGGGFPSSRRSGRKASLPKRLPKIGGRRGGFRTGGGF
ncbi:MAG: hypothetical protein AAGJ32_01840 [Pseudomonadota bacterium]